MLNSKRLSNVCKKTVYVCHTQFTYKSTRPIYLNTYKILCSTYVCVVSIKNNNLQVTFIGEVIKLTVLEAI